MATLTSALYPIYLETRIIGMASPSEFVFLGWHWCAHNRNLPPRFAVMTCPKLEGDPHLVVGHIEFNSFEKGYVEVIW